MESSNPLSSQSALNISVDLDSLPTYQRYLELLIQAEDLFMEDEVIANYASASETNTNKNYRQPVEKILCDENLELSAAGEELKSFGVKESLSTYIFKLLASYTIKNSKRYSGSTEIRVEKIYRSLESNLPLIFVLLKSYEVPAACLENNYKTVIRSSLNYYRNNFFDLLLEDWSCWEDFRGRFTTFPPVGLSSLPGEHPNFRGRFTTSPYTCPADKNALHVFIRDLDKNLLHCLRNNEEISVWERIEGEISSAPCAVSFADKSLQLFAKGRGNVLLHTSYSDRCEPWKNLGGHIVSAPTACLTENGELHIFARGAKDDLMHIVRNSHGQWSDWESLAGGITSAPSCVTWGCNRVDVFARGKGNNLFHLYLSESECGLWENLGGCITSAPSATSRTANRLDVFARGSENQLLWRSWKGVCWSDWIELGGYLTSAPSATSVAPHSIDVFAKGSGDKLMFICNK
jgi:hypothetical protein